MYWAKRAREAYLAIGEEYRVTRTRPLPVADLGNFGERALDVGSGRGAQPLYLQQQHSYVVHCDLDKRLLPGGDSLECEATLLPFRDGAFDVVYLVAVLHHMPREAAASALREAKRVGKTTVATVWRPDRGRQAAPGLWEVPWGRKAVRLYYTYGVGDLLTMAGGGVVSLGFMKRRRHYNLYIVIKSTPQKI